jgi:hypothetical protein
MWVERCSNMGVTPSRVRPLHLTRLAACNEKLSTHVRCGTDSCASVVLLERARGLRSGQVQLWF